MEQAGISPFLFEVALISCENAFAQFFMILLYLAGCWYGFLNLEGKKRSSIFPPTTDILCDAPFSFAVFPLNHCPVDLFECLSVSGHCEFWQGEKYGAVRLTEVLSLSEASFGQDVQRLEDTVCSPEACSRAPQLEFSNTHPSGLVDHCPGLCGRVRTKCYGESPPHSPLPWKQASPYCAYCYP